MARSAAFTPLQRPNESAVPKGDARGSDLKVALQTAGRELDAAVSGLRRDEELADARAAIALGQSHPRR